MFLSDKDIYESLNFSVTSIKCRHAIRKRISCVFIIFTFSLAEIRLCRTDVRQRNGYSTILRIFIYSQIGNAKKVQTEKVKGKCFYLIKTSMKAQTFTDIN